MAYDPLTGKFTPDIKPATPNVAYQPESGKVISGSTDIGSFVDTSVAAMPKTKKLLSRTPRLDKNGKLMGYNLVYDDGSTGFEPNPSYRPEEDTASADEAERLRRAGQSAYDILLAEFTQYGLASLVEPLKSLIVSGPSAAELTLALRATDAYKKRFAANTERIKKGLTALNEATYLGLEDKYQSVMRNYGLPATYYSKDTMGRQEGFEKLIANDVSATELEDRILTAQNRVINAPAEVTTALKQFYPDITNGDILAYTLDPDKALTDIKRKVTAAEIGGAAIGAGLGTSATRAEELAKFGVTGATARQGYQAAVPLIERGRQLSAFYQESPYTQASAEEELFNLSGAAEATQKRKKLSALETAEFSGRAGLTGGALSRDRAGAY
jgi:hypothetical protein